MSLLYTTPTNESIVYLSTNEPYCIPPIVYP